MAASARTADGAMPGIAAAVARLQAAARTGHPCAPVRDLIGTGDADLAYAVQHALSADRVAGGAKIVGHKIGLTSAEVQAQLGVDRPDFGLLFDDMAVLPGETIDVRRLLQPKIEAEIAFLLAADITDPEVTAGDVRAAVARAAPALEIVDSRIAGWDITFADTVADNASSGLYTLGSARVSLEQFEPAGVTMTMTLNGAPVSAGRGSACLGDPLNALAWLARIAVEVGTPLSAGDVVLSGALGPMIPVAPGAQVRAEISGLGSVEATFTDGNSEGHRGDAHG
jgi:2-keto-4-pentenoate hydratase